MSAKSDGDFIYLHALPNWDASGISVYRNCQSKTCTLHVTHWLPCLTTSGDSEVMLQAWPISPLHFTTLKQDNHSGS